MFLAIDPGNEDTAFVLMDENFIPYDKGKIKNTELIKKCRKNSFGTNGELHFDYLVIEMVASYGMPVGKTVFDTCVWIGRFVEACHVPYTRIYRMQEKMDLCQTMRAKDSNIRQALIDRFGKVGTKKNPGFFYGFKKDIWAAFAVGTTYLDMKKANPVELENNTF